MKSVAFYREEFVTYLQEKITSREPRNLYDPMVYILNIGGKRLRPVSVLMTAELFGCPYQKALDAALAIEIFHNFSLVHDDIMDHAPVRRGKPSVHKTWDVNTAILSGDAMLINAYQLFENYENETFKDLAKLFTKTAMKVCEGQQYDVDFESINNVDINDYLKMIEYKTAVLVGAAMEMGAIVAQASNQQKKQIYKYGLLLGLAFQLKDDYLDVFGNYESFGKQIGGDIIENKKTYLYLKAVETALPNQEEQLKQWYATTPKDPTEKINAVTQIYSDLRIGEQTLQQIKKYTEEAFQLLENMTVEAYKKDVFKEFGERLMKRKA